MIERGGQVADAIEVSLLLCYHNAAERLPWTLAHLARLHRDVTWELVAVDNASSDHAGRDILAAFADETGCPVQLMDETRPGKQWAFQTGAMAARGKYLVIVDDDNGLSPDYLSRMVAVFDAHPEVAMVGGRGVLETDVAVPDWFEAVQFRWAVGPQGGRAEAGPLLYIWGAGTGLRCSWVQQVLATSYPFLMEGPTGEKRLDGGEDVEWGFIFQSLGKGCWYEPGLVYRHKIPGARLTKAHAEALKSSRQPATAHVSAYYRPIVAYANAGRRQRARMMWGMIRKKGEFPLKPRVALQLLVGAGLCVEQRVQKLLKIELK